MIFRKAILSIVLSVSCLLLNAQGTQEAFGQNRIQYHGFEWSFFKSDNFVTYFNLGGQDIGRFVVQIAEGSFSYVQQKTEYAPSNKIEILVFNDITDLRQSNVGMDIESFNTGGLTEIAGNKIFVYFNGNHQDLERQIKEGIARVFIGDMMYGGNIQEIVQNAILLSLPGWFTDGFMSYIGEEWSTVNDNIVKDGILSGRFRKINKLSGEEAKIAGHSVCYYIAKKYGKSAVPSLLYLARVNRNIESAFLFVLGKTVNETLFDWKQSLYERYSAETEGRIKLEHKEKGILKTKRDYVYTQAKLSPDTLKIAYVKNTIGRYKVRVYDFQNHKQIKLFKRGYRTLSQKVDYKYPLTAWSPSGKNLAIVHEKKDQIKITMYDTERFKKTHYNITKFQRVLSFDFIDEKNLVISAMNRGQSDIYTYFLPSTKLKKITEDFYDDLEPKYIKLDDGHEGFLFASNRTSDSLKKERLSNVLPTNNYDIFFYNSKTKSKTISRVTNTPLVNERSSMQYDNRSFSYIGDKNGIDNRYTGKFITKLVGHDTIVSFEDSSIINPGVSIATIQADTNNPTITNIEYRPKYKEVGLSFPATDFSNSLVAEDVSLPAGIILSQFLHRGKTIFMKDKTKEIALDELANTAYMKDVIKSKAPVIINSKTTEEQSLDSLVQLAPAYFQSKFDYELNKPNTASNNSIDGGGEDSLQKIALDVFKQTKVLPYRFRFTTTDVTVQLDNSLLFTRYQSFKGNGGVFSNPSLSPLAKVVVNDILEDIRFLAGFRIPTNFNGGEYFIQYDDFRKRLDKSYIFYRKGEGAAFEEEFPLWFVPVRARVKTNLYQLNLSWPINIPKSIRVKIAFRNDKIRYLSLDTFSLSLKPDNQNWITTRLEYVLDNSITPSLNIWHGTKIKLYAEFNKQINDTASDFFVLGMDLRHSFKLHRELIWANRISAGTSFGNRKLVYYLGGVDSWIGSSFNNDIPVSTTSGYAFQTIATNLRGFSQNIRNGNSHVVINSEVRWPILKHLINKPIKSEVFRNFQIIAFGDIGATWQGLSPFDEESPFNTETIGSPPSPVTLSINFYRNPIVGGTGFGFRSKLFGYFVRLDFGWGIDTGVVQKAVTYLSFSKDF